MYEFILEYPNEGDIIHWNQTENPIDTTADVGYHAIHVPAKLYDFKGLGRSADSNKTQIIYSITHRASVFDNVG